jgi:hypothetical protein
MLITYLLAIYLINMTKATITTKSGSVITIEGDKSDIANIISKLEGPSSETPRSAPTKDKHQKRESSGDLILGLKEEGFFSTARNLNDIVEALSEKGYAYPSTSLSGVMIDLVKKRLLGRKKVAGKWVYGK